MSNQESFLEGLNCHDCNGACCRAGTGVWLSRKERGRMKGSGAMQLKQIVPPLDSVRVIPPLSELEKRHVVPPGFGYYELLQDCGNLSDDSRCDDYANRPKACQGLEVGSIACLVIRAKAGYVDDLPADVAPIVAAGVEL